MKLFISEEKFKPYCYLSFLPTEDIKGRSILKMIQECLQEDGDNFV